jgi:Arc/MetJ-type ribon-helix-helix transcriptional regulator
VATTTVRLDAAEEELLDRLAGQHGGRSNALREGLRLLAAHEERQAALTELLRQWEEQSGPASEQAVEAMTRHYDLDS